MYVDDKYLVVKKNELNAIESVNIVNSVENAGTSLKHHSKKKNKEMYWMNLYLLILEEIQLEYHELLLIFQFDPLIVEIPCERNE